MDRQPELNDILQEILGSSNVYFQPPADIFMDYPAIVYQRDRIWTEYASNMPYAHRDRYQVTHISRNPVDSTPDKLKKLPMTRFMSYFTKDNLNHNVFSIYF